MRFLHLDQIDDSAAPWLVCLDIQRDAAGAADPAVARTALSNAHWLLSQARRGRWPIAHLHRRSSAFSDQQGLGDVGPVAGFEPLPSEPLFVRSGLSAFSSARFREWTAGAEDQQLAFIGLGASATWLATTLCCPDLGMRPCLVEDAIAVAPLGAIPADSARRTVHAVTAPFVHWITASAVVERAYQSRRPLAANQP